MNKHLASGNTNDVAFIGCDSLIVVSLHDITDYDAGLEFPNCRNIILILDHKSDADISVENLVNKSSREINGDSLGISRIMWDHSLGGGFDEQSRKLLHNNGFRTAYFLHSQETASGRIMLALRALGVRSVIFEESGCLHEISLTTALLRRIKNRTLNLLIPKCWLGNLNISSVGSRSIDQWAGFIKDDNAIIERVNRTTGLDINLHEADTITNNDRNLVWQYTGCLNSGGAERQLVNLAIGLANKSFITSEVYTSEPLTGPRGHYKPLLEKNAIKTSQAGYPGTDYSLDTLIDPAPDFSERIKLINLIPSGIRTQVLDLLGELWLHKPRVLNCWLDYSNIVGGLAGLIAGVPVIVLSTRNVNPSHFPEFYQPWMPIFYKILQHSRRIKFVSNSRHGADDYARWLNMDPDKYTVVRNGIDSHHQQRISSKSAVVAFRKSMGIPPEQPLIAGVFRLSPEKRPDIFVKVIRQLLYRHNPQIKAVIAGIGPLHTRINNLIKKSNLQDVIYLLGQRDDIPLILAAADVMLLTSKQEGMPNCILEAMAYKCPVVAAINAGTNEIIEDGVTGILREGNDIDALCAAVNHILTDSEFAADLTEAAYNEVLDKYSCEELVESSLVVYQSVLTAQKIRK